ncbi:MAG: hypothetical protein J2P41_15160 [Blastocatellia bacterium]|nr:hypothetical protein [Blastocatellia bacterium]
MKTLPGPARFQRAGFYHGPMWEARTLEGSVRTQALLGIATRMQAPLAVWARRHHRRNPIGSR